MKLSEFKSLIREEVKKILSEGPYDYDQIKKLLKGKPVSYKVGAGSRTGTPVDVDTIISILSKNVPDIAILQKNGITFTKAFANVTTLEPTSTGYGPQKIAPALTFSLIGTDSEGNEIIYDRYEGSTHGGRQIWIFVNGKKQQASEYIRKFIDKTTELTTFLEKLVPGAKIDDIQADKTVYVSLANGKSKFDLLSQKQNALNAFWKKHGLPPSLVYMSRNPYTGKFDIRMDSSKTIIRMYKEKDPNSFMIG
jgi:hypothetical protein